MKYTIVFTFILFSLGNLAFAQSNDDLYRELERERILTEIALVKAKRESLNRERDYAHYENQIREIDTKREAESSDSAQQSTRLRQLNEIVNIIGNGAYMVGKLGQ